MSCIKKDSKIIVVLLLFPFQVFKVFFNIQKRVPLFSAVCNRCWGYWLHLCRHSCLGYQTAVLSSCVFIVLCCLCQEGSEKLDFRFGLRFQKWRNRTKIVAEEWRSYLPLNLLRLIPLQSYNKSKCFSIMHQMWRTLMIDQHKVFLNWFWNLLFL